MKKTIISLLTLAVLVPGVFSVVNAQGKDAAKAEARTAARIEMAKKRANQELDRRIDRLTNVGSRAGFMKRVGEAEKKNISGFTSAEVEKLNALKTKIAAETDLESVKTDIKSIKQSYRIFALVVPQLHIRAAADKVITTADLLGSLRAKLSAKIEEAKTAGKDVVALTALLTDFDAKIADAKTSAQSTIAKIASLVPDNGDEQKFKSNKKILGEARELLKVGEKDLKAAREDAKKIANALKEMSIEIDLRGGNATGTATTTPR